MDTVFKRNSLPKTDRLFSLIFPFTEKTERIWGSTDENTGALKSDCEKQVDLHRNRRFRVLDNSSLATRTSKKPETAMVSGFSVCFLSRFSLTFSRYRIERKLLAG